MNSARKGTCLNGLVHFQCKVSLKNACGVPKQPYFLCGILLKVLIVGFERIARLLAQQLVNIARPA
jgi:hypothetical protein